MTATDWSPTPVPLPAHVPPHLAGDFDFRTDAAFQGDPQANLHKLQARGPLFYSRLNGGHWVIANGVAAADVFSDPALFSANTPLDGAPEGGLVIPMGVDPPTHGKYRRPIDMILTPKAAKAISDEIREFAIDLIENVRPNGKCEFLSEVAEPFPVTIFLRLAGLPLDRLPDFRHWAKTLIHSSDAAARAASAAAIAQYLTQAVEARRAAPGDDILSALAPAEIDGRAITPEEFLGLVSTIFIGGLDTVLNALTFIIHFLANNEAHRRRLIDDPALIPHALEEMMRRFAMVSLFRKVTQDTHFHGVDLKANDRVWCSTVMIGMDETLVQNPLDVDFDRASVRNPIFGIGPHHCPGRHLARLELRTFLEEWLKRIPDFAVQPGADLKVLTGNSMGFESLPLQWSPR